MEPKGDPLSLKSGSLLSHQLTEQEILNAKPFFSPELQVWRTPLSDKLMITGTVGVNKELVELHDNFPRFNVLHPNEESEQELLK